MSDYIDRVALGIGLCTRDVLWIETQEPLGWCDVDCAECSVCPNCGAKNGRRR